MLRIDVLRHGETALSGCLRGSIDDALTPQGWRQMQQGICTVLDTDNTGVDSEQMPWQAIWTSPLQRCAGFAQQLSERLKLPLYYDAALQEMHFGDWEGQSIAELYQQFPEQLAEFWQHPTRFSPPQAESVQLFQRRVIGGLQKIVIHMQDLGLERALLVSHGGVIKLLKCLALGLELDLILTQSAELGQLQYFSFAQPQQQQLLIRYANAEIVLNLEHENRP